MKTSATPAWTIGVEEEFFLIDAQSYRTRAQAAEAIVAGLEHTVAERVQCQVETNTPVCDSLEALAHWVGETRGALIEGARAAGCRVLGSGTHPSARWQEEAANDEPAYNETTERHGDVVRSAMTNGLHIHLGLESQAAEQRAMRALSHAAPLLIALSASSPFYGARATGVQSYRQCLLGMRPHAGAAPQAALASREGYERQVQLMTDIGAITSERQVRWDVRRSWRHPTIEVRVCDACPDARDTLALAALVTCIALASAASEREPPHPSVLVEHRWQSARHATRARFRQPVGETRNVAQTLEATLEGVAPVAAQIGAEPHLERCRALARDGASSERQVAMAASGAHGRRLARAIECALRDTERDGS